jgi:hypothetical protein
MPVDLGAQIGGALRGGLGIASVGARRDQAASRRVS